MKILSLFSGAGGLDLGMKLAGHDIVWANDIDADAVPPLFARALGDELRRIENEKKA